MKPFSGAIGTYCPKGVARERRRPVRSPNTEDLSPPHRQPLPSQAQETQTTTSNVEYTGKTLPFRADCEEGHEAVTDPEYIGDRRVGNLPRRPPPVHRKSFLETFIARQQNKEYSRSAKAQPSRVLYPINHVPRPTPIRIPTISEAQVAAQGEERSLLSLPEQRRSRQNSPASPTVQASPRLYPDPDNPRSSIALPRNQQSLSRRPSMPASPRSPTRAPQSAKTHSRNNSSKQYDVESQKGLPTPASGTFPGATYGLNPADHPSQPPRRVNSQHSLKHGRSLTSLHSPRTNDIPDVPPLPPGAHAIVEAAATGGEDHESLAEELAWGPSHPCYPHLNPHVPLSSPEYKTTRVIRIKRDWMIAGDLAPTYSNIYPEILDPALPEPEFRFLVEHVNATLVSAFDPFSYWNWLDGILGLLTGWFWEDFRPGSVKGKLKNLERWMEQWNEMVGARDGVRLIPLRRTGYMSLDIQIPDPQVRVMDEGEEEGNQEAEDEQLQLQQDPDHNQNPDLRISHHDDFIETDDGSRI